MFMRPQEVELEEALDFEVRITPIEGVDMEDLVETLRDQAGYVEVADSPLSVIDKFMEFYFYDEDGAPVTPEEDDSEIIYGSLIGAAREPNSDEDAVYRAMRVIELVGKVVGVSDGNEEDEVVVTISALSPRSQVL
jgi:hypothetical protein